jgi:hypothetical protein
MHACVSLASLAPVLFGVCRNEDQTPKTLNIDWNTLLAKVVDVDDEDMGGYGKLDPGEYSAEYRAVSSDGALKERCVGGPVGRCGWVNEGVSRRE